MTLQKFAVGVETVTYVSQWNYTGGKTWANGESHLIKIVANGTTFSGFVDWNDDNDFGDADESLGDKTDSTHSGTGVGVFVYSFNAWIDNLMAGDL